MGSECLFGGSLLFCKSESHELTYVRIAANEASDEHIPDLSFYFCHVPGVVLEPGKTAVSNTGEGSALLRFTAE